MHFQAFSRRKMQNYLTIRPQPTRTHNLRFQQLFRRRPKLYLPKTYHPGIRTPNHKIHHKIFRNPKVNKAKLFNHPTQNLPNLHKKRPILQMITKLLQKLKNSLPHAQLRARRPTPPSHTHQLSTPSLTTTLIMIQSKSPNTSKTHRLTPSHPPHEPTSLILRLKT